MNAWAQGFCIGAIVTTVLYLLLSIWAALSLSGTISQQEEEQRQEFDPKRGMSPNYN